MNRCEHLAAHYAHLDDEQLIEAVARIYLGLYDARDPAALERFGERLDRHLSREANRLVA